MLKKIVSEAYRRKTKFIVWSRWPVEQSNAHAFVNTAKILSSIKNDAFCVAGAQPVVVEQREPVRPDHRQPEQLRQTELDYACWNQRQHVQLKEYWRRGA